MTDDRGMEGKAFWRVARVGLKRIFSEGKNDRYG
jgi:hypothetical protein